MEKYRNLGGDSGVSAYEIGTDYILVKFSGGTRTYTYSYKKAGSIHVENMKQMARRGSELNGYINKFVKNLFD